MTSVPLTIRPLEKRDLPAVHGIVMRAFETSIAPGYAPSGIETFARYASQTEIARRIADNHTILVAETAGTLAGVVEVRRFEHVSMLFVDPAHQRNGIGRALLDAALALCASHAPKPPALTVNSAPSAVAFYKHAGFRPTGPATDTDGIVSVPMAHVLA